MIQIALCYLCVFIFLVVLGFHCCAGFFPAAGEGGYSLVAVRLLLTALAPLVAEMGSRMHGLQ